MLITTKLVGIVALALLLQGCQAAYEPTELDTSTRIPVVEGLLSNTDGPHLVSLYYARPYTIRTYEWIRNATVFIMDSRGVRYNARENEPGRYTFAEGVLKGEIGVEYVLTANLRDGTVIKSPRMVMPDTIPLGEVTYKHTVRTEISRNPYGEPIEVNERGIGVFASISNPSNEKLYFRTVSSLMAEARDIQRSTLVEERPNHWGVIMPHEVTTERHYYCYNSYRKNSLPNIGELIPNVTYPEGHLNQFMYLIYKDESYYTEFDHRQWIIFVNVYSMSPETYSYYHAQIAQLNAKDRIFDPIPNQIAGNLYVLNNPDQLVLGNFEVSSLSRRIFSIYVVESLGMRWYNHRYLPDTISVFQGCYLREEFETAVPVSEGDIPL